MGLPKFIKPLIKKTLPSWAANYIQNTYLKLKFRKYRSRTLEQTFDEVYHKKMWAPEGSDMLSGAGSYGDTAERYVDFLQQFIKENEIKTITDIGCGDFNIGSRISVMVEHYNAFDVSGKIIERNKQMYPGLNNVLFKQQNACYDPIPKTDLVVVREVLQHLTNEQIELILANIEKSNSKYVLISDMSVALEKISVPNKDLYSHGPKARNSESSAVVVFEPPFSRNAKVIAKLPGSQNDNYLYVYLWLL